MLGTLNIARAPLAAPIVRFAVHPVHARELKAAFSTIVFYSWLEQNISHEFSPELDPKKRILS